MGTPSIDNRAATLDLTAMGWSEDRIARVLGISSRTVRRYRAEARDARLEVESDTEIFIAAMAGSERWTTRRSTG